MQIVWREAPAVVVQVLDGGPEWHVHRPHVQLLAGLVRLAQIAGGAGGDHVFPGGLAAAAAWDQVIEGQILAGAAILTLESVAQENVEAGEGRVARRFDEGLEGDHAG